MLQLEAMDGKPLKAKTPYASVKPLRMSMSAVCCVMFTNVNIQYCSFIEFFIIYHLGSQAGLPTQKAVSPSNKSVHLEDPELHQSESEEDQLRVFSN